MSTIGIIGAMEEEIVVMKEKINITKEEIIAGCTFFTGSYLENKVILVKSGIGKVNGAICAQAMIDNFKPDAMFMTGVAGALSKELAIGDIVISEDTAQHDMDTSSFGDPIGVIPRMDESFFPADKGLLDMAKNIAKDISEYKIIFGRIASGDQFISSEDKKSEIEKTVGGLCAEMEGAAIAQACWLNKVPFLIIRAISDGAGEEAFGTYEDFCVMAAKRGSNLMEKFLMQL